jgi:hypothetical protein
MNLSYLLCPKSPALWFGSAAGYEAVACPAVQIPFDFLGYALVRPLAQKTEGLSPDQGHSPGIIRLLTAGQSHRLTSGGKAVVDKADDFRGKASYSFEHSLIPSAQHVFP